MNFHSKNWQRCQTLETVKNCEKSQYGTNLCFLGNKKPEVSSERKQTFQHESLILAQDERWRRA